MSSNVPVKNYPTGEHPKLIERNELAIAETQRNNSPLQRHNDEQRNRPVNSENYGNLGAGGEASSADREVGIRSGDGEFIPTAVDEDVGITATDEAASTTRGIEVAITSTEREFSPTAVDEDVGITATDEAASTTTGIELAITSTEREFSPIAVDGNVGVIDKDGAASTATGIDVDSIAKDRLCSTDEAGQFIEMCFDVEVFFLVVVVDPIESLADTGGDYHDESIDINDNSGVQENGTGAPVVYYHDVEQFYPAHQDGAAGLLANIMDEPSAIIDVSPVLPVSPGVLSEAELAERCAD